MADREIAREVQITSQDGSTWRFRSWHQFIDWLQETLDDWDWLTKMGGGDPANLAHYFPARLNAALNEARQHRDTAAPLTEVANVVNRHLSDAYSPPHPKSERGLRILEIRRVAGDVPARFATGIFQGLLSWQNVNSNDDWRGMALAMNPEILTVAGEVQRFTNERANYRSGLRRQAEEFDLREQDRHDRWSSHLGDAGDAAEEWARKLTRRWLRTARALRLRERVAMEKLKATDAAFTEKMALKAPVEYWEKKAKKHLVAENEMQGWLWLYFPLAFILIAAMFGGVGYYILTTPKENLPHGLFIVASAGLAAGAGMLFWIGRLLTKLYLSQHHLRQDAEERATMTTTYLALTEVTAAGDMDRQIVLNALFRSTPDGIVKEDGGLDPSIAAAIGKYLAR